MNGDFLCQLFKLSLPRFVKKHVLNDPSFGNYLIFAGVPPMIDDRIELYGDFNPSKLTYDFLDEKNIDWTLTLPYDLLNTRLESDPKWVRIYTYTMAVVYVRKSALEAVKSGGGS
jgi:hypothetical protein